MLKKLTALCLTLLMVVGMMTLSDNSAKAADDYTWQGTQTMTAKQIVEKLGVSNDYSVFANTFENKNHMEGNICVKKLKTLESQTGNSANPYSASLTTSATIHLSIKGTGDLSKTYYFALYSDLDGTAKVANSDFTITTDSNGSGSKTLSLTLDSSTKYFCYELDGENGNPVKDSKIANGQTITYTDNCVANTSNVNYIKEMPDDSTTIDLFNADAYSISLFVGDGYTVSGNTLSKNGKTYNLGSSGKVKASSLSDADWPIDFDSEYTSLKSLSSSLANLKSDGNVNVINVAADSTGSLTENLCKVLGYTDYNNDLSNKGLGVDKDKYTIINVDCGSNQTVTLQKVLEYGSFNSQNSHILWNFVSGQGSSATAYTGTVTDSAPAMGTLLCPAGSIVLDSGTMNGAVIADYVSHANGEIHKVTFGSALASLNLYYTNKGSSSSTTAKLEATKTVNNATPTSSFNFKLIEQTESNGTYTDKTGASAIDLTSDKSTGQISKSFTYDTAGTYYYKLSEVNDGVTGYTYDTSSYLYKVVVTKADDGTLSNVVTVYKLADNQISGNATTAAFNNTYTEVKPISVTLNATKKLNGVIPTKSFKFTLKEMTYSDGTYTDKENGLNETLTNAAQSSTISKTISYSKAGTYYYKLSEVNEAEAGYVYDSSVYYYKVVVTETSGVLSAVTSITNASNTAIDDITFNNTAYTATDVTLNATKTVNKETPTETFSFDLKEMTKTATGYAVDSTGLSQTLTNTKGNISASIHYTLPGTHYYMLSEVNGGKDGYTYDNTQYIYKVDVTAGDDGQLKATTTISKITGESVDTASFANTYENVAAKTGSIKVIKTNYSGKTLKNAVYAIYSSSNASASSLISLLTTDENGSATSGSLALGTYYVKEYTAPAGYTVDPTIYSVNVTADTTTLVNEAKGSVSDAQTEVKVSKVDSTSQPLKGATLAIYDASGNEVMKWTTDGTTKDIKATLVAGAKYTLKELSAPSGYTLAADQTFTVPYEGADPLELTMTDTKTLVNTNNKTSSNKTKTTSKTSTSTSNNDGKTVQTGDATSMTTMVIILFVSMLGMLILRKRTGC